MRSISSADPIGTSEIFVMMQDGISIVGSTTTEIELHCLPSILRNTIKIASSVYCPGKSNPPHPKEHPPHYSRFLGLGRFPNTSAQPNNESVIGSLCNFRMAVRIRNPESGATSQP